MNPIALDEFCNLKFLSDITYSPDGKKACLVVSDASKEENSYYSNLYLLRDGNISQLTSGGNESEFVWLDSDILLFPGDREKTKAELPESRFYRISVSGGEAALAFSFPVSVKKMIPLSNGDFVVTADVFPGYEMMYTGDPEIISAYRRSQKENEDYEIVTKVPWWWNGSSFSRNTYTGLYYYNTKENTLRWLSEKNQHVSDVKISKDGSTVYYSLMDVSVPMPAHFGGENIYRMDLKTMQQECVCLSRPDFMISSYELGTTFILLIAADGKFGMNTDPDFFKLDYHSLEVSPYVKYGYSIGSSICTDIRMSEEIYSKMSGDTFYFISTREDSANLYKLENGNIIPVIEKEGSIDFFDICGDELLLISLWDMNAQELYDGNCRKISSFNDQALVDKYIAAPEKLILENQDHSVHGFVMKPIHFEKGKKYPVILDVHGGPKCAYGAVLFHEMAYWTGLGYFVIYCNPTGSDGRGPFMNILGKYGTVDYEDIMAFCDAALETYPEMDASNLFETGGSYGGFMTNWIIGHTNRFNACASQRSISNWISFYGVSDIGVAFSEDQNNTSLWPSPEKMWWHSPMKYADQCKTPTLFIHSFEDYRCPIDQGYQMYTALVAHGVESRMVLFKGENHELSRTGKPKHRIKRLEEITQWFETHKR